MKREVLEVSASSSNFCDLGLIIYFMPQSSHLCNDEVILLWFMILFWLRPISIKNAVCPGQVKISRVRWNVEVQRYRVTLKKNIGERGLLHDYVSYVMSPEQKFHKEKAYEAAVRPAIHSPLWKSMSPRGEMFKGKAHCFCYDCPKPSQRLPLPIRWLHVGC